MRKLTNRALFICFALMTSFCLIAPATALRSYAQEGGGSTLEGLIKDDSGPLLGATVIVKNTTRGTTTDMDGKFRLEGLQPGDVLQVTYVGYDPYEVTYTGQTTLDILMTTTANQLNAVVVTAMGIERQSKTLSYAAETVGGDDVADIKSVNMINALQGKAAGLQITPNSTGAGGSSKILFRGNKSINGSNQPLVVVDGVPLMMNITSEQQLGRPARRRRRHVYDQPRRHRLDLPAERRVGRRPLRCGSRQRRHHDHDQIGHGRASGGERIEQHDH